jgi:hypothetical protein
VPRVQGKRTRSQPFGAAAQQPYGNRRPRSGPDGHRLDTQVEQHERKPCLGRPTPLWAGTETRKDPEGHAESELLDAAEQEVLDVKRDQPVQPIPQWHSALDQKEGTDQKAGGKVRQCGSNHQDAEPRHA